MNKNKPRAIAIISSTGGPQALQVLFAGLKHKMPGIPIFITQHMPPVFTKNLAHNLSLQHNIQCHEAEEGMEVKSGHVYIAPGDFHMLVKGDEEKVRISIDNGEKENFCRPSAEPMLRCLDKVYGGNLLVIILTGMGRDGISAATQIAANGGTIIVQDESSSVVWGMPGAAFAAGIASGVYPIGNIAREVIRICGYGRVKNAPQ